MNTKKNLFWSILLIVAGTALLAFSIAGKLVSFWSGFGGGLIGVAIMQLIRQVKYKKDPKYKEKCEIEQKDERNRYIRSKASEFCVSGYVILMGLACIVLSIMGKYEIVYILGCSVGALMLLYVLGFFIISKRS